MKQQDLHLGEWLKQEWGAEMQRTLSTGTTETPPRKLVDCLSESTLQGREFFTDFILVHIEHFQKSLLFSNNSCDFEK